MLSAAYLLADIPAITIDHLAYFIVSAYFFVAFGEKIKNLLGWDKPAAESHATKGELAALQSQVALSATRAEVEALKTQMTTVQLGLERLKTELIEKTANSISRLEDRISGLLQSHRSGPSGGCAP